tara:strand:+ start:6752 stop:7105 length:354 start_codon:yes stop_codon:yes gene_type:complete
MVRKNYKWNISKEEGEQIIDDKIKEILSDKGEMEISELNFFIQTRSRDITIENNKKKKNLTNFIRNVFGGLRNFLESRKTYKITNNGKKIMVDIKKVGDGEDIYFLNDYLNDWIIVD